MKVIYTPAGKAREYSEFAINLYKGCSHACSYCYAPSATFKKFEQFISPDFISVRPGILEALDKELEKEKWRSKSPVMLSFTSDAYQELEKTSLATRYALHILARNGVKPQILTKSGLWGVERDIEILKKTDAIWAATLTCDNDEDSIKWEPGAALPEDRIAGLKFAKENGLETWVSFEPVLDPNQVFNLIDKTRDFVDLYKIGKINYHPLSKSIDWGKFLFDVERKLGDHPRYIKKDLEAYRSKIAA